MLKKKKICNVEAAGNRGSIPESGRSPGGGNGNLLQYSCLKNPMDRGAWRATVHGVAKESFMTKQTNKKNQKPNNIASVYIRENKIKWRSHIHNHI